jgi:periplasmic protein TonB
LDDHRFTNAESEKIEPPKPPEPPRPAVKQPPAAVVPDQVKFNSNMSIVDDREKISPLQTIDENTLISNVNITAAVPATPVVQPVTTTTGVGTNEPVKVDKNIPLGIDAVDVAPSFPGGMDALLNFLRRHLSNPEPMGEGESVTVKVTFVVGYEGKLKSFKVTEDGGEQFNKEVIRVLKKMPDWIPGKAKGENVAVYYTIPVKFTGAD